jgi:hypothetical protein
MAHLAQIMAGYLQKLYVLHTTSLNIFARLLDRAHAGFLERILVFIFNRT